jgi:hypothetical protein
MMATIKIEAPEGYHWMDTAGGPSLMAGDYTPHEGASAEYEFEVIEEHQEPETEAEPEPEVIEKPGPGKHSKKWDEIFNAILEQTGDSELAAATATARVGKREIEKRLLFVVSTPSGLDVARGRHLCGPSGERFAKSYLEPVGLKREQVDVIDLGELSDHQDDEPLAVIALGTAAREVLGKAADLSLPHPAAIRKAQHAEALERRISDLDELIEKVETSFLPPKGVQEAARRGLELRREHRRGGTAVGVARARDLANGRRVSISTIKRMVNYFVRHQKDMTVPKNRDRSAPGYPGAGRIAWLLWGGDSGQQWANTINERYEREREREKASKRVGIYKADESKRIVYGVVLDPYIIDAHDDYLSPAVIEETAHDFLSESRVVGLDHNGAADGAKVVESWIQPYPTPEDYKAAIEGKPHKAYAQSFGDDVVRSGSWVLGVKLTPELWSRVQSGELNGFSIGGYGQREDMAEGEMPEVEFIVQG